MLQFLNLRAQDGTQVPQILLESLSTHAHCIRSLSTNHFLQSFGKVGLPKARLSGLGDKQVSNMVLKWTTLAVPLKAFGNVTAPQVSWIQILSPNFKFKRQPLEIQAGMHSQAPPCFLEGSFLLGDKEPSSAELGKRVQGACWLKRNLSGSGQDLMCPSLAPCGLLVSWEPKGSWKKSYLGTLSETTFAPC